MIVMKKMIHEKQLPWVEKYRPNNIDHIISHKEIIQSLVNFIDAESLPHLLFFGPSGSGKTSTIKCCAKKMYDTYINYMVLELNASNERGIETVRTKIKNFVNNKISTYLPKKNMKNVFKLVILDEIDSMTVEAQGMLRQTIEKNSKTARFCLICNDIDKINVALQSRCAMFRFAPLSAKDMLVRLKEICTIEQMSYNKNSLDAIIKITKGDMRAAINLLQHVNQTVSEKITVEHIYNISGHCLPKVNEEIYDKLIRLSKKKIDMITCVDEISELIIQNDMTIFNLLEELKNIILEGNLSTNKKLYLIDNLAKNEIYDSVNIESKIIIMIIISMFIMVDEIK